MAPMIVDATRASDRMETIVNDVSDEIVGIYRVLEEILKAMIKPQLLRKPSGSYTSSGSPQRVWADAFEERLALYSKDRPCDKGHSHGSSQLLVFPATLQDGCSV